MINMSIAAGFRATWSYIGGKTKTDTNTFILVPYLDLWEQSKIDKKKFIVLIKYSDNPYCCELTVFQVKQSSFWRGQLHSHHFWLFTPHFQSPAVP